MPKGYSSSARNTALNEGASVYQGAPCMHGHDGLRYASNRGCVECGRAMRLPYDRETGAGRQRAYRAKLAAQAIEQAAVGASLLDSI